MSVNERRSKTLDVIHSTAFTLDLLTDLFMSFRYSATRPIISDRCGWRTSVPMGRPSVPETETSGKVQSAGRESRSLRARVHEGVFHLENDFEKPAELPNAPQALAERVYGSHPTCFVCTKMAIWWPRGCRPGARLKAA